VLIDSLKILQSQERLTGAAMAARLDISAPLWSRLCSGERAFSKDMLAKVLLLWPALEGEVLAELRNGGSGGLNERQP